MILDRFAFDNVLLSALARSAIEGALAVGVVALVLRLIPRTPASVAALLWWLACARFVVGLTPLSESSLALPVTVPVSSVPSLQSLNSGEDTGIVLSPENETAPAVHYWNQQEQQPTLRSLDASRILAGAVLVLWIGGALVCFFRGIRAVLRSRESLAADSEPPSLQDRELLSNVARNMGLRRIPRLLLSRSAHTPHLLSLGSPTIVLPREVWPRLDQEHREMILAHELLHLRRRDEMWSWLPWLVECAFWFHPFARIAAAEFALAREAACDAEVMRRLDASPRRYGELLLRIGAAPRMSWAGIGVAPDLRSLRRRISMLDRAILFGRRRSMLVLALAALATFLPLRFEEPEAMTSSNARDMKNSNADDAALALAADANDEIEEAEEAVEAEEMELAAEAEELEELEKLEQLGEGLNTTWIWNDDDADSFYLFDGNGNNVQMMGSFNEYDHARVLAERDKNKRQIIVREGRSTFVIDDAEVFKKAQEVFRELEPFNRKQQGFGLQQSELGARQSELGRKQAELGLEMAKHGEKMAKLQVELQHRVLDERDTDDLEAQIEEIGSAMEQLGAAMQELGEQQSVLGEKQSAIGEKQSVIGEEQSKKSAAAREKIRQLVEQAKEEGLAREIE